MLFLGVKLRVTDESQPPVFDFGLYGGNLSNLCDIWTLRYVYYLEGVGDILQAFYPTGVFVIFFAV